MFLPSFCYNPPPHPTTTTIYLLFLLIHKLMSFSLMVPRACAEIKEALMPRSQREETQDAAKSEAAAAVGSEGLFLTVSPLCTCGGRRWRGRTCSLQWRRATLLDFKGSSSDNCLHHLLLLLRECGHGRVTTSDCAQYGTFSNYPVNGPIASNSAAG